LEGWRVGAAATGGGEEATRGEGVTKGDKGTGEGVEVGEGGVVGRAAIGVAVVGSGVVWQAARLRIIREKKKM
jgi:hypothetical protein